jgi:hypothetical protein
MEIISTPLFGSLPPMVPTLACRPTRHSSSALSALAWTPWFGRLSRLQNVSSSLGLSSKTRVGWRTALKSVGGLTVGFVLYVGAKMNQPPTSNDPTPFPFGRWLRIGFTFMTSTHLLGVGLIVWSIG